MSHNVTHPHRPRKHKVNPSHNPRKPGRHKVNRAAILAGLGNTKSTRAVILAPHSSGVPETPGALSKITKLFQGNWGYSCGVPDYS
ncbi:unnamed protein product [Prunus armeniaca]